MAEEEITKEQKSPATNISKIGMYAIIAKEFPAIMEALREGLHSNNPNYRLGAAKTLLNKILPDLKAVEVSGGIDEDGKRQPLQLLINAGNGFIPATIQFTTPPAGSTPEQSKEIQDADLAPESPKDDNSDIRDSEAGSS